MENDSINRQAAIDRIVVIRPTNPAKSEYTRGIDTGLAMAMVAIKEQPPAQTERKRGEWIVEDEFIDCSVCRREKWSRIPYGDLVRRFRYCPNCGADMRGEQ